MNTKKKEDENHHGDWPRHHETHDRGRETRQRFADHTQTKQQQQQKKMALLHWRNELLTLLSLTHTHTQFRKPHE